ncbi:hypothetical protein IAU60_000040 [Kwoniella sp. DSM 27419]
MIVARPASTLSRCVKGQVARQPLVSSPHGTRALHTTTARAAMAPFKLHDIGEGIAEVEVLKWYVEEGQEVQEFDALCEVQSDKSVVELTSHAAGTVRRIKFPPGKMVKVGQVLCEIDTGGEMDEAELAVEAEQAGEEVARDVGESTLAVETQEEGRSLADETPTQDAEGKQANGLPERTAEPREHVRSRPPGRRHPLADPEPEDTHLERASVSEPAETANLSLFSGEGAILPTPPRRVTPHAAAEAVSRREGTSQGRKAIIKASPAVRTLAARLGVDLSQVRPTGEGGRVSKADVEAMAPGGVADQVLSSLGGEPELRMQRDRSKEPEHTRVEFGRTRKVMYRALGGQGSVPHFGYAHTLDLTPLLPHLKAANPPGQSQAKPSYLASDIPPDLIRDPLATSESSEKTTLLTFLVKAMILALEEHPIMRSRVREAGQERWLEVARDGIVGVAVSDPKHGLLTPSLPPLPPSTPLSSITSQLQALRGAPNRASTPAHLTISSVGSLGESRGAMPVIPPGGGLAICAVGRAKWEVEWKLASGVRGGKSIWDMDEGEVVAGGTKAVLRVPVGWSGDHRVLEGAELIAFTETWKKYIEEPWRWLSIG